MQAPLTSRTKKNTQVVEVVEDQPSSYLSTIPKQEDGASTARLDSIDFNALFQKKSGEQSGKAAKGLEASADEYNVKHDL